ncbi:MAG TPA: TadE/TadG family type IV pilus assembly protein [Stellaceae bacterium]|nr:TadE/TadG family type IV pilus assembly protein [Stellaceae bacterium]
MSLIGRLRRDRAGSLTVDFAMIIGPLLSLLLGTMEIGRLLWYQNALNYSVEEGARCATIDANNCGTTDQVKSYSAGKSGAGFAATVFSVSAPACGNKVSASYPMSLSIPFVSTSITLTAQSCYPK